MELEGVTKFSASHLEAEFPSWATPKLEALLQARGVLRSRDWIGIDPARYGGVGYGNVSIRVGPMRRTKGQRSFVVSGTQTSDKTSTTHQDYAVVHEYEVRRNWVRSSGPARPSSESMTHGMLYDIDPSIVCVLHVHWPECWAKRHALKLPTTPMDVRYGTPEMARATRELFETTDVAQRRLFAMAGHEDGIVSFGESVDDALSVLLSVAS